MTDERQLERERHTLQMMTQYMRSQGALDSNDLHRLEEFVEDYEGQLRLDWSPILQHLDQLKNRRPHAGRILEAVKARASDPAKSIDKVCSWIKSSKRHRFAFLVGAGASCGKPTEIPVVRDFLPILWNKAAEIGHRPLLRMRDQCKRLGVENIEDLLTAISLAQAAMGNRITLQLVSQLLGQGEADEENVRRRAPWSGPSVDSAMVDSLRESTQTLFAVLVGMMVGKAPNEVHKGVASLARQSGATVVTTNYDTCLEAAIGDGKYDYGRVDDEATIATPNGLPLLVKLHGSLNWYSCVNCHRFFRARLDTVTKAFQEGLYPIMSICPTCQAPAQQLVVPPIAQKYHDHPMFLEVRKQAEDGFQAAGVIVVIGYSFSEADEYILRMLSRAVRTDDQKTIVIFDTSFDVFDRLKTFLETHVRSFNAENNVHFIRGNAVESFPGFCKAVDQALEEKSSTSHPATSEAAVKLGSDVVSKITRPLDGTSTVSHQTSPDPPSLSA